MKHKMNKEGLTVAEWMRAAGVTASEVVPGAPRGKLLWDAWEAGEDPSDWRAEGLTTGEGCGIVEKSRG